MHTQTEENGQGEKTGKGGKGAEGKAGEEGSEEKRGSAGRTAETRQSGGDKTGMHTELDDFLNSRPHIRQCQDSAPQLAHLVL